MNLNGKHLDVFPPPSHYNPFGHVLFLSLSHLFFLSIFLFPAFSFAYWQQKNPKNLKWLVAEPVQVQRPAGRPSEGWGERRCLHLEWRHSLVNRAGPWAGCPLTLMPPQLWPPWRCLPQKGAGDALGRSEFRSLQRLQVRWYVQQVWWPFPASSALGGEEQATACPFVFLSIAFFFLPCLISLTCTRRVFPKTCDDILLVLREEINIFFPSVVYREPKHKYPLILESQTPKFRGSGRQGGC